MEPLNPLDRFSEHFEKDLHEPSENTSLVSIAPLQPRHPSTPRCTTPPAAAPNRFGLDKILKWHTKSLQGWMRI